MAVLEHDVAVLEAGHRAAEAAGRVLDHQARLGDHLGDRPPRLAGQDMRAVPVVTHGPDPIDRLGEKSGIDPSECRVPGRR
ncbi:hypothetical protein GCM10027436_41590 [Actinophytocola sediminis]